MTFYPTLMAGNLVKSFFNITRTTNLETETKLAITINITNIGGMDFSNASIEATAPSGNQIRLRITAIPPTIITAGWTGKIKGLAIKETSEIRLKW